MLGWIVAALAGEPLWLRCGSSRELDLDALGELTVTLPDGGLPYVGQRPPEGPVLEVPVEGPLPDFPAGPVLVAVDGRVEGPRIEAMYRAMLAAKSTPHFLGAGNGRYPRFQYDDAWDNWRSPEPTRPASGPVEAWTEKFRACAPVLVDEEASCDTWGAAWREALLSGRCGLARGFTVVRPATRPGSAHRVVLDPRAVRGIEETSRWSDLAASPPAFAIVGATTAEVSRSMSFDPTPSPDGILAIGGIAWRRSKPVPSFPGAANGQQCTLLVLQDARGRVLAAQFDPGASRSCPEAYAAELEALVESWRAEPYGLRDPVPARGWVNFVQR